MKYLVPSLVVFVVILAAFFSFFLGKTSINTQKSAATVSKQTVESPILTLTPSETVKTKNVTAGGILNFPRYELTVPAEWEEAREFPGKDIEKIILKREDYEITIAQGGFGGAICLYPGDTDVDGPSARYESFKELETKSGEKLRRSWTGEESKSKGFAICQDNGYGWQAPTLYGHISLTTPVNSDPIIVAEMDKILSSLMKI